MVATVGEISPQKCKSFAGGLFKRYKHILLASGNILRKLKHKIFNFNLNLKKDISITTTMTNNNRIINDRGHRKSGSLGYNCGTRQSGGGMKKQTNS